MKECYGKCDRCVWYRNGFGGYVNCSECDATPLLDGEREYVETPYCPNCGAKMDMEEEDEN